MGPMPTATFTLAALLAASWGLWRRRLATGEVLDEIHELTNAPGTLHPA